MCNKEELLATIERKRNELVQIGLNYGLNSAIALKQSQELDRLLNNFCKTSNNEEVKMKKHAND